MNETIHRAHLAVVLFVSLAALGDPARAADPVADCDRLAAHPEDPQKVTPCLDADKIDYPAATAACEAAVAADAGYVQAQYIYATFIVRGRPYAPKDLCLADQYWRKAAAAGRQSARVQYVRYALRGSFANCPGAATWQHMRAMLDAAAKDATGIYQQALVEDLGEALAARHPDAPRAAACRCEP